MHEFGNAIPPPGGNNEDFEVFELRGGRGFEFVDEGFREVLEGISVFGLDDEVVAVEAMPEGIETGFELALAGLGAGAVAGIAAVSSDLLFSSHGFVCPFSCDRFGGYCGVPPMMI